MEPLGPTAAPVAVVEEAYRWILDERPALGPLAGPGLARILKRGLSPGDASAAVWRHVEPRIAALAGSAPADAPRLVALADVASLVAGHGDLTLAGRYLAAARDAWGPEDGGPAVCEALKRFFAAGVPAGHQDSVARDLAMLARRWIFDPGMEGPKNTQGDHVQLLYVISGSGKAIVDGQSFELDHESVLWLEPGETYHFVAGKEGLEILQGYATGE